MLYLCIDQGGSSTRSAICDKRGNILTRSQISVDTKRNKDMVEQDPDQIVNSILETINDCLSKLSLEQTSQLQSASLVCQRSSLIAFDTKAEAPLTNIISWQDTRAKNTLNRYLSEFSEIQDITGLRPNAHYGISKILWLLENDVNVKKSYQEESVKFLPLASYLVYALTKKKSRTHEFVVDPANASRTMLMGLSTSTWSNELLKTFDLNADSLPIIQNTIDNYGELFIENILLPLSYVNGDQSAAFYAFGNPEKTRYLVNLGTGAFISTEESKSTNTVSDVIRSQLRSIVHQDDKQKTLVLEGTVNGAGAALDEMKDQLSKSDNNQNENLMLKQTQTSSHTSLDSHNNIPIFINGIGGVGSPYWLPSLESYFIGSGDNIAKLQAVRESIAFYVATNILAMEKEKNLSNDNLNDKMVPSIKSLNDTIIYLSGGLSKDTNLVKLIANLTNMDTFLFEESEASILGSVWWLAGQPRDWRHGNHIEIIRPTVEKENKLDNNAKRKLHQRFNLWQQEMASLC